MANEVCFLITILRLVLYPTIRRVKQTLITHWQGSGKSTIRVHMKISEGNIKLTLASKKKDCNLETRKSRIFQKTSSDHVCPALNLKHTQQHQFNEAH